MRPVFRRILRIGQHALDPGPCSASSCREQFERLIGWPPPDIAKVKKVVKGVWKRSLPVFLIILYVTTDVASAQTESRMLKRQTARVIRNAGFWCDRITDARIDKTRSADGPTVVKVTCDDKTNFAQYQLTMTADNKITKVENWK